MSTKSTKRIWEVCEPHPDVFARDIEPSMFAASLHAVESGTADRITLILSDSSLRRSSRGAWRTSWKAS